MLLQFISSIQRKSTKHHFLFIGESNSRGFANNSDALSSELDENSDIQIFDNTSIDGDFENLNIGAGNNWSRGLGYHGLELPMQNHISELSKPVYLTKAGQGGSVIADWGREDSYWTTFLTRFRGSKLRLEEASVNTDRYVFVSIGINDAGAGTDPSLWYSQMESWIQDIITEVDPIMLFITEIPTTTTARENINTQIDNLVAHFPMLYKINSGEYTLLDSAHWNTDSFRLIMQDIINLIESN